MPQYLFSVGGIGALREAGMVQSESFADALTAIAAETDGSAGDTLEIGVWGFPPARFERVWNGEHASWSWLPITALAA